MPYRCQKCLNTFKTLTLYNKHATGPAGACNVVKIEVAKPVLAPVVAKPGTTAPAVAKASIAQVGLKREGAADYGSRGERKKTKSYKEVDVDAKDRAEQIIAEALGDDSDHDPDYNPKGDKEDDEDADLNVNRSKIRTFTPTASINKSYSRIIVPSSAFSCTKCNKKFETVARLDEHVEDEHERSCAVCEDDFSWPDASHECYFTKYKLRMVAGDIMPAF